MTVLAVKGGNRGILSRLFGQHASAPETKQTSSANFAFVLLSKAQLPDAKAVVKAFQEFTVPNEELWIDSDASEGSSSNQFASFVFNTGEKAVVALIPFTVPGGEAEEGVQFSLSKFGNNGKIPLHSAHLLVSLYEGSGSTPLVRLSRFISLLAAVTKASSAVGVYWGNAGATHDSKFFLSVASEKSTMSRIMLWSGVSMAREKDGRLSFLSLGMDQLGLPDLLLISGEDSQGGALQTFYSLLSYVAERGEPLPEGDTVGRTPDEDLPVHYVASPVDSKKKVWRVELP